MAEEKIKLNLPCEICKKGIFLNQDIAQIGKVVMHTDCLKEQIRNQTLEDVQIELCVYGDGNPKTCICSNCSKIEGLKKARWKNE